MQKLFSQPIILKTFQKPDLVLSGERPEYTQTYMRMQTHDKIKNKFLKGEGYNIKTNAKEGTFKGYASIFNVVDNYGDVVLPGAFRQTLQNLHIKNIKLLWQHDCKKPIGVFTKIEETVKGLLVEGKIFTDIRQGKEANMLLQSGVIDGLSIGYEIEECFYEQDIRYIKQAKLWEISIVTFPANEAARIKEVRSQELIILYDAVKRLSNGFEHAFKCLVF